MKITVNTGSTYHTSLWRFNITQLVIKESIDPLFTWHTHTRWRWLTNPTPARAFEVWEGEDW